MEETAIRIADLMEQIKRLSELIDNHRRFTKDKLMISQYEEMRNEFIVELEKLFNEHHLQANFTYTLAA